MGGYVTGEASSASPDLDGLITFNSGEAVTAASYQMGRDLDATNQLHFNIPTGATYEWSINDVARLTYSDANNGTGFNVSAATITTGFGINCNDANALISGAIFRGVSNSPDATGRNLLFFRNQNVLAVGTTTATFQQDASNPCITITHSANGTGLNINHSGNGNSIRFNTTLQTTASIISCPNADTLTSAGIFNGVSNSADVSARNLFFFRNQNVLAIGAIAFRVQQDSTAAAFIVDRTAISSVNNAFAVNDQGTGSGGSFIINKSGASYGSNIGVLGVNRTGSFTGVNGETGVDLFIKPAFTLTEPGAGSFNFYGSVIDLSTIAVTAGAGTSVLACYYAVANADTDAGSSYSFFADTGAVRFDEAQYVGTTPTAAATYNVISTDYIILSTRSLTGSQTVNLPAAASNTGRVLIIKDVAGNASANNITLDGNGAETIDTAATLVMAVNYQSVTLVCNGTAWSVI